MRHEDTSLTLFSWGYHGWGNSLPQLLAITEAAERARGFFAAMFVDVRFSRSVRAEGFRDDAFARALPPDRYVWLKALGNEDNSSGGLKIHEPAAAAKLLDLATGEHSRKRRVVFFCHCDSPARCHRNEVRRLVLNEARSRGLRACVVEWPGGEPVAEHSVHVELAPASFNKVVRDAPRIPIDAELALGACATLAWGSYVELTCGNRRVTVAVGPAQYGSGKWYLPRFIAPIEEGDTIAELAAAVKKVRASENYGVFEV